MLAWTPQRSLKSPSKFVRTLRSAPRACLAPTSDAVRALDSGAAQVLRIGSAGATNSAFAGFIDDLLIDRGSYDLVQTSPTEDYDLVSDPKLSQVALAYTFSGADGLTSLNPEIGPATVSFGAATSISTADSMFGGSSLYVGLPSPLTSTSGVRSGPHHSGN